MRWSRGLSQPLLRRCLFGSETLQLLRRSLDACVFSTRNLSFSTSPEYHPPTPNRTASGVIAALVVAGRFRCVSSMQPRALMIVACGSVTAITLHEESHAAVVGIPLHRFSCATVGTKRHGWSLHQAALAGNECAAVMMLAAGTSVNIAGQVTGVRGTALQAAAREGHEDVVSMLLAAGAAVNSRRMALYRSTALHKAVEALHEGVVKRLLAAGASVNTKDNDGRIPVDYARHRCTYPLRYWDEQSSSPACHRERGGALRAAGSWCFWKEWSGCEARRQAVFGMLENAAKQQAAKRAKSRRSIALIDLALAFS